MSKIICVDFDGVLHSYISGWQGVAEIPDPPVPGAMAWLTEALTDSRFTVAVYSSRSKDAGGVEAMSAWLHKHMDDYYFEHYGYSTKERTLIVDAHMKLLSFPTQKPAAFLTIDDRAICFRGVFPPLSGIDRFQPWTKRRRTGDDSIDYDHVEQESIDLAEEILECIGSCLLDDNGQPTEAAIRYLARMIDDEKRATAVHVRSRLP